VYRRTTSLPADHHVTVTDQLQRYRHRSDNIDEPAALTPRSSAFKSPLRLRTSPRLETILKKLQPSRRRRADVTCRPRRPVTVHGDVMLPSTDVTATTSHKLLSSFDRLQRRRNGLADPTCLK